MLTKHFSKVRNLLRVTLLFGVVALLSYCTSSPKTASSFGKRKYTKGHFSDPVAKVKMEYKPYDEDKIATSTQAAKSVGTENTTLTKISDKKKEIIGTYVAAAKKVETVVEKQAKSIGHAIAKSPLVVATNLSLKENSVSNSYPYVEHGYIHEHGDDNKKSTYLLIWIIALVVSLLCLLIAAAAFSITTSTAGCSTGCILLSISSLAGLVAIIFFILWLVALSS